MMRRTGSGVKSSTGNMSALTTAPEGPNLTGARAVRRSFATLSKCVRNAWKPPASYVDGLETLAYKPRQLRRIAAPKPRSGEIP
jgi:hypothetical protein